jgi:hypothetical protein
MSMGSTGEMDVGGKQDERTLAENITVDFSGQADVHAAATPTARTATQRSGGIYRNPPESLNGFLTSTISPGDLLRSLSALRAINSRGLLANAVSSGRELRRYLCLQGMNVWGWGLMVWFDEDTGEPANALTSFSRALPPLTFGSSGNKEWREIVVIKGQFAKQITNITMVHALSFRAAANMDTELFLDMHRAHVIRNS